MILRTLIPTSLLLNLACSQTPQPTTTTDSASFDLESGQSVSSNQTEEDVQPAPNPGEIQAAVQGRSDELRQCYIMGTFREPQLAGTVHVRFTISSTGKVSETTDGGSNLPDPEVVQCVLGVFAGLEFRAGKYYPTEVEYPISFGKS